MSQIQYKNNFLCLRYKSYHENEEDNMYIRVPVCTSNNNNEKFDAARKTFLSQPQLD